MTTFEATLQAHGMQLRRTRPRVLQINVGKLCNLTCVHCHVNAGPKRKEILSRETADRILAWQASARLPVVDLTGGAPEMIPDFRYLVTRLREIDPAGTIIDRCNLTILLGPGYEGLAEFLAAHRVEIVASMPCYSAENVNAQRGEGVFDASIAALQRLNSIGYGLDPELPLWDIDPDSLEGVPIATGNHCYGCTAGAGSSCGGAIESPASSERVA
jgi:radical SAM/Cys-rich protein